MVKIKSWRKPKGQSRMNNPVSLATIGHTTYMTKTNKTKHNTENYNDEQHIPHLLRVSSSWLL
jgi:hypothetical protein